MSSVVLLFAVATVKIKSVPSVQACKHAVPARASTAVVQCGLVQNAETFNVLSATVKRQKALLLAVVPSAKIFVVRCADPMTSARSARSSFAQASTT